MFAEERVRIDDVVDLAPLAPLPGERTQGERLARAGLAVPEDELTTAGRLEVAHQSGELVARARGVVRLDLAPRRNGDRPPRGTRPLRCVHPEGHRYFVGGAWIGWLEEPLEAFDDRSDRGAVGTGRGVADVPPPELHFEQDAVFLEQRAVPALRRRAGD